MVAEQKKRAENVLSGEVAESNTVQEQGGSFIVALPKDSARDLGIEKGDPVLFLGEAGDESLEVGRADRILRD